MLKKIQLALYDSGGYMPSLADYLCRKSHSILEARLFTNRETLECAAEAGGIDVLLAGEEVLDEVRGLQGKIPQIVLLAEESQAAEQQEYYRLFKYQSAQSIVKEVLAQIAEDDRICYSRRVMVNRTADIIGIYAPFGGAGVTEYALSLARGMAKNYRTLYVDMELFQGLDMQPEKKRGKEDAHCRGMSEVVFYLKQRRDRLALKLETLAVSRDGLDYICAVEDYRDLYSISAEDIDYLLRVLLQQTEYEKVVFDIGFMGDSALRLMEQCTQLYMPEPVTKAQKLKEQAFSRFLAREGHGQMARSFRRVERKGV